MPKIIWCGNKSWDTDFPENTLPNNAKRIERPDNIFKSSLLYGILPLIFSYAIICIKWFMIGEKAMNPIYVPFGIILGLLLLPVHEVLHGVCYKKGQKSLHRNLFKKFAAFCSMSRTNQQTSFCNNEFNAYAFRYNTFGYISFISTQCISFGNMYSNGDYWYAFSNAGLHGCPHYLQTST